jgi:hypothetical protein
MAGRNADADQHHGASQSRENVHVSPKARILGAQIMPQCGMGRKRAYNRLSGLAPKRLGHAVPLLMDQVRDEGWLGYAKSGPSLIGHEFVLGHNPKGSKRPHLARTAFESGHGIGPVGSSMNPAATTHRAARVLVSIGLR